MRMVSVLGDSISTYEGYNPRGYAVYYDREKQYKNGMNSVYDTWWAKVNQRLRAYLCVNNSYSGSRVTGTGFPAACCEDRLAYLRTDTYSPDIILIYMGFNDFGNGVKIKRKNAVLTRLRKGIKLWRMHGRNVWQSLDLFLWAMSQVAMLTWTISDSRDFLFLL